jgi:riboflavin biosynthesis pyrimidine reductase
MRALLPAAVGELDVDDAIWAESRNRRDQPWLLANMISSVDGAATVEGRSGALGGPADQAVFKSLRGVADVVLVGAGTVRAERYGPPKLEPSVIARRTEAGRDPLPRIAMVSGSLDIDPSLPVFADPALRPLVITHARHDAARRAELDEVADVWEVGNDTVDLAETIRRFAAAGAGVVLCEGGPSLLGQLHVADLVDEWCVTLGPVAVAGASRRIATTATPEVRRLTLDRMWEDDGLLFLRYLRRS